MTVTVQTLVEPVAVPAAETVVYTSPVSTRTIIDKATLTNTTATPVNITVKTPSAATPAPSAGNTITSVVPIAAGATYPCPDLVGHTLNGGDSVSLLPSVIGLTFRMSGRTVVG